MTTEDLNGGPETDTAGEMSIADSLRAAWDASESASTTTETTPDTDTAASRDDGRDERGRFAAKQAAEAAAADPANATTAPAEPPTPAETPAAPAVEAPQHWAAADKELFGRLPPDGQKFLLDRHKSMEGEFTRNMQAIAPIRKVADHWQPYLQQFGPDATPDKVFNHLLQAEYDLRHGTPEQKTALFRKWAQDYQIDLGQPAQPAVDEYADPQVTAVRQELAEMKAWRASREQAETQHRQQQEQQQLQALQSTITSFEAEKTEAGAPAHPHFDAVRDTMAALIGSKQATDLKTAYDMAVWARPDLRQQLLTAQQDAAAKKSAEEAKAKALKATTAGSSVSGSPVGQTSMPPAKSIREELERAWSGARA